MSFEVKNNKFWILEQKEGTKKHEISAWVFQTESAAIKRLKETIADSDELEMDEMSEMFNLQEIEIAAEKYNVKPISWAKVAFMLLKGEKI